MKENPNNYGIIPAKVRYSTAISDFEKKHPQHKDRLVIQEWVFDIYDVEANDWIIVGEKI